MHFALLGILPSTCYERRPDFASWALCRVSCTVLTLAIDKCAARWRPADLGRCRGNTIKFEFCLEAKERPIIRAKCSSDFKNQLPRIGSTTRSASHVQAAWAHLTALYPTPYKSFHFVSKLSARQRWCQRQRTPRQMQKEMRSL